MPETFNVSAPIQPHDANVSAYELRERTEAMVAAVVKRGEAQLGGLPACTWRPAKGCTNTTQYECMAGKRAGACSGENWHGRASNPNHNPPPSPNHNPSPHPNPDPNPNPNQARPRE